MSNLYAKVVGIGKCLPEGVLSNADLEKMVDTSDEWITQRVGVKERRIADEHTYTSDLAANAAIEALKDADMQAEELDLIILATITPDMMTPSCACMVQTAIGAVNAAAFDLNAACPGFIFALVTAQQFIASGMYKNVLVIGVDCLSKVTEYQDRNTCVLFGDGAGAFILQASEEETGVLSSVLGADGKSGEVLTLPNLRYDEIEKTRRPFGHPHTLYMDGKTVFKFAIKVMSQSTMEVLESAGYTLEDIALIIPHQANLRIIDSAQKRIGCAPEKMYKNIEKYGNMSSACIPVAFCCAVEEGRLKRGDKTVLVSMGGGLTWGAVLLKY